MTFKATELGGTLAQWWDRYNVRPIKTDDNDDDTDGDNDNEDNF